MSECTCQHDDGVLTLCSLAISRRPSQEFSFGNLCIKNMAGGIIDDGVMWNYHGYPINIKCVNVDTSISYGTLAAPSPGARPDAHPAYGVMGPWSSADTYPVKVRPEILYTTSDFPVPFPLTGFGGFGATDAPGMSGTAKPYFWLDTTKSKLTLDGSTQTKNTIAIEGAIVDRVGVRRFEDWQSPESGLTNLHHVVAPGNYHSTPQRLVERNGCYTVDAGTTWNMRMWFVSYERMDGSYFLPHVDISLINFPPSFLSKHNIGDPMSTRPVLPLQPEGLRAEDIDLTTTVAPTIVSRASLDISENEPLQFFLQSSVGLVLWSLSGADSAQFTVGGGRFLEKKGGGGFDYEMPTDVGGDNTYNVNLIATEPLTSKSTTMAFVLRVIDKIEMGVQTWTDDFMRPAAGGGGTAAGTMMDLADGNPYWLKSSTSAASIYTDGSGSFSVSEAVPSLYVGAPLATGNLYEFSTTCNRDGGYFQVYLGLDSASLISVELYVDQNTWKVRTIDASGTGTPVETVILSAPPNSVFQNQVLRMTYDKSSGTVTLYRDGTTLGTGSAPTGLNVRGPYIRTKPTSVDLRAFKGFTARSS